MQAFEKLGVFYLGRRYDADTGDVTDDPILYDAKDLTTHAVCVGMTGSGKTGLCIGLIEEAAIDGIPTIVIDPKGDMGNLLLTFPELRASDFAPWIDPGDAQRRGRTPDEHAKATAELWRKGLGDWGQDGARVGRFADSVERVIYTPGSTAGRPVRALRTFRAPLAGEVPDEDAWRERIMGSVSSLLALLGIDADPLRSREHILLSTILDHRWREGRHPDLRSLIRDIQSPPVERIGVFDLDAFFPEADRLELAMTLNNVIASPGFAAWTEGDPLDAASLLFGPDGRPRISIFSIAHLSDAERMFFVTMLLHEIVAWVRSQPGSRTLRALVYMDEIFGFFPPVANPPSKPPMLTLLKQARAYGLGVVLATQNPVDLDYKGLSNAGTWFIGRLQTERDKARVIEGLEGAAASAAAAFDRREMEETLAGLGSRVFLLNNVHEDGPVLFHTRWALSYLAGPMTREQIKRLTPPAPPAAPSRIPPAGGSPAPPRGAASPGTARPIVPVGITEGFLPPPPGPARGLVYRPALLGSGTLHFVKSSANLDLWRTVALLAPLTKGAETPWGKAERLEDGAPVPDPEPTAGIGFSDLPKGATDTRRHKRWASMLKSHLYQNERLTLHHCKKPKLVSTPAESEDAFIARLRGEVRELRDMKLEKLRQRYAPKLQRIRDRIERSEARLEREEEQLKQRKSDTMISVGATVLGALFGRKIGSVGNVRRGASAMRSAGRISREKGDVGRAGEVLEEAHASLQEMEAELEERLAEIQEEIVVEAFDVEALEIAPRKGDLTVEPPVLLWIPEPTDAT